MRKLVFALVTLSSVALLPLPILAVGGKSAFDYEVIFRAGSLYCLFDFPREAHKGDTYEYELNVTADATVQITTFEMNVIYWDLSGEHTQTHNIANYVLMGKDENLVTNIQFTVPSTISWLTILVNFNIYTDEVTDFFLGVFATHIVDKTSWELSTENFSLRTNYTNIKNDYENYKDVHSYLNSEYNDLNSSYDSMKSNYESLQEDYNELESKYQAVGEPVFIRNLMYIFLGATVVFMSSTVYFVVRKPKVKPA